MDFDVANNSRLDRLDASGNVLLTRYIQGEARFVRPYAAFTIGIITEEVPDGPTRFFQIDSSFKDVKEAVSIGRFTSKSSYQPADRSAVVFGGVFGSGWTAAVGRLHGNSSWGELPLQPLHSSYWFNDATPTGRPNEFATVRQTAEFLPVLAWITIEK
jgi:hypothetical protein